MLELDFRGGYFSLLDHSGASPVLTGRRRIFFAFQLTASPTENEDGWIIPPRDNVFDTFLDITSYLNSQRFEFQLLEGAEQIREQINAQQEIYQNARAHALTIKETNESLSFHPPNFIRPLQFHQMLACRHLLGAAHGANFSVPGSGKTAVAYGAYDTLREEGIVDGLLVIGPPSCFMAWNNEYVECFGTRPSIVRIAGRNRDEREGIYENQGQYEIFLTTYQTAYRDVEDIIEVARRRNLMVILDESHYVKQIERGRYAEAVLRISPNAVRRVILTGTPMPNGARDLWTQITFLWPNEEVLGNRRVFTARENDLDSIREDIRPFYIRIRKRDLGLPEPRFHFISVSMSEHQAAIYRALAVRTLAELDLAPRERQELRRWRRAKMIRLLQASSNPTLLSLYSEDFRIPPLEATERSLIELIEQYSDFEIPSKVQEAIRLAREIVESGRKVLIWTWFIHNIAMLSNSLSDLNPLEIHGGVPRDENIDENYNREQIINHFLESPTSNVLIANPAACAESISLHTACHDAIYLDRNFNCGQYLQSLDRIHRIGLEPTDEINYHILLSENTIDEVVRERLGEKERRMYRVIDEELPVLSMEAESEDVSDDEIDDDFDQVIASLRGYTRDG